MDFDPRLSASAMDKNDQGPMINKKTLLRFGLLLSVLPLALGLVKNVGGKPDRIDPANAPEYRETNPVYTIAYDPYKNVDWYQWRRALAQHHDHLGRTSLYLDRIKAYDDAGYSVIASLGYAGKRSGDPTYYCTYRLWPVYKYISGYYFDSGEPLLAALKNIKLFIPAMEDAEKRGLTRIKPEHSIRAPARPSTIVSARIFCPF